jgi:hypothetical protein
MHEIIALKEVRMLDVMDVYGISNFNSGDNVCTYYRKSDNFLVPLAAEEVEFEVKTMSAL